MAAESIRSITDILAVMGNASVELIEQLREKTAAIVSLLLERPMQTLESTASELLTDLIDGYFELVSTCWRLCNRACRQCSWDIFRRWRSIDRPFRQIGRMAAYVIPYCRSTQAIRWLADVFCIGKRRQ